MIAFRRYAGNWQSRPSWESRSVAASSFWSRIGKSIWRTPMPAAFFVVRATVADPAKRKAFDEWYRREHLPDAVKAFGVEKAWRFLSVSGPSLDQATHEVAHHAAADRTTKGGRPQSPVARSEPR